MILSFRINGAKMTDKNPRPADSADNYVTNQWPLELSEHLNFDDDQWLDDDPDSFVSGHAFSHNNQANEVGGFGGSGTHFEESSSSKPSSLSCLQH